MKAVRLLLILPLLASCSGTGPGQDQLQADFLTLHPGCQLLSSSAGEGDSDNVYIWSTYTCDPSGQVHRTETLYQQVGDEWVLDREGSLR